MRSLRIEGLTASYRRGEPVLDGLTLDVPEGQVVGLLGGNGAGKTTLLNWLLGVHTGQAEGTLTVDDARVAVDDPGFARMRYGVFTEDASFARWTMDAYLSFVARVYGLPVSASHVDAMVDGFGFDAFRSKRLAQLSTGGRKKFFLIAAFSLRPRLVVLDEPVDGLDFSSTEFLYECIKDYSSSGSVLLSSHIAESFEECCDRLYLLEHGRVMGPYCDEKSLSDVRRLADDVLGK